MIVIDYQDRRPLYEQIVEKFKQLIVKGVLESHAQMPSVRSLAVQLAINPNTIQRAYAELERQGFIYPVKGRGNFVAPSVQVAARRKEEYLQKLKGELLQGREMGFSRDEIRQIVDETWRESE